MMLLAELNTWLAEMTVVPMPAIKTCITSFVPLNMKFSTELGRPMDAMERIRDAVLPLASARTLTNPGRTTRASARVAPPATEKR